MTLIQCYEILHLTPEEFRFYPDDDSARDREIEEIRVSRKIGNLLRVLGKESVRIEAVCGGGISLVSDIRKSKPASERIRILVGREKNDLLAHIRFQIIEAHRVL